MTKPKEKTCEELTAEIEDGKKKIRQFENREKMLRQKLSVEECKARNYRLCKRGGFKESLVPELMIAIAGQRSESLFTACLDEPAGTGVFEKTSRERERVVIPLGQKAYYTPLRACAHCRGLIYAQGTFPALRYGDFPACLQIV